MWSLESQPWGDFFNYLNAVGKLHFSNVYTTTITHVTPKYYIGTLTWKSAKVFGKRKPQWPSIFMKSGDDFWVDVLYKLRSNVAPTMMKPKFRLLHVSWSVARDDKTSNHEMLPKSTWKEALLGKSPSTTAIFANLIQGKAHVEYENEPIASRCWDTRYLIERGLEIAVKVLVIKMRPSLESEGNGRPFLPFCEQHIQQHSISRV